MSSGGRGELGEAGGGKAPQPRCEAPEDARSSLLDRRRGPGGVGPPLRRRGGPRYRQGRAGPGGGGGEHWAWWRPQRCRGAWCPPRAGTPPPSSSCMAQVAASPPLLLLFSFNPAAGRGSALSGRRVRPGKEGRRSAARGRPPSDRGAGVAAAVAASCAAVPCREGGGSEGRGRPPQSAAARRCVRGVSGTGPPPRQPAGSAGLEARRRGVRCPCAGSGRPAGASVGKAVCVGRVWCLGLPGAEVGRWGVCGGRCPYRPAWLSLPGERTRFRRYSLNSSVLGVELKWLLAFLGSG